MIDFLSATLKKLLSSVLIAVILFIASYSFVTGEFPPKWANLKSGITNLQNQLKTIRTMQEQRLKVVTTETHDPFSAKTDSLNKDQTQALNDELREQIKTLNLPKNSDVVVANYNELLVKKINDLEYRLDRLEQRLKSFK